MPQSLAKILVHTAFSTKDRQPFLHDKALRAELHRYLGGILANHDCQPFIIGGVEDHVHLLSTLSRTCEAAEMVKEIFVTPNEIDVVTAPRYANIFFNVPQRTFE
jgi:putative transposase